MSNTASTAVLEPTKLSKAAIESIYSTLCAYPFNAIPASKEAFQDQVSSLRISSPKEIQAFIEEALSRLPDEEVQEFQLEILGSGGAIEPVLLKIESRVRAQIDSSRPR